MDDDIFLFLGGGGTFLCLILDDDVDAFTEWRDACESQSKRRSLIAAILVRWVSLLT